MKWYDEYPRLDERKATAADTPKHRARKNTRKWCKGKVGRPHTPEIRLEANIYSTWHQEHPCYRADWWTKQWERHWSCSHQEYCTTCGKILQFTLGNKCPNYEPTKVTVFRDVERAKIKKITGK